VTDERLHEAWHRNSAVPSCGERCAGLDLLDRWAEPQRHYHTTDHLRFMLAAIDAALAQSVES